MKFFSLRKSVVLIAGLTVVFSAGSALSQSTGPLLVYITMCEAVINGNPENQTVVFSIEKGEANCFTAFDNVTERTFIYHNWFRIDRSIIRRMFVVNPPSDAVFSTIQLRDVDKGPWRVEITTQQGKILNVIRFSVTD